MKPAEEYEKSGREFWHRGEYEQALKVLQEGLSYYPKNVALRLGVSMAHLRLGNFVVARDALKILAGELPGNGDVLAALSEAYLSLGKKKDALVCIREAARHHGSSPGFLEYLALMLSQHGLFKESVFYYKLVIKLDPARAYSFFGLGVAYSRMRNPRAAVENLEKAVSLKKDFYEALSYLGNMLYDTGRRSRAMKIFLDIPVAEHMDPTTLSRLMKYCKKKKEYASIVAALEEKLQEVISGRDILKFVRSLEDSSPAVERGPGGVKKAQFEKIAELRFVRVWKDAQAVVPQAKELYEIDKYLARIFTKPFHKAKIDRLPEIVAADRKAVEGFISSLAVYLRGVADRGELTTWGPISHWGKMWGINDLSPYAIAVIKKIYEKPNYFPISQVSMDALLAAVVNILKWMPPGLRGSEWIVELGGIVIAFWTRKDMLERFFLMREILSDVEKKCVEPLVKRGRSWRRWMGYKADRAWAYPSTELFKEMPKTLGAGQPVRCLKCRRVINDYWDIADFNDAPPVRCGDCAVFKRCGRCQGPMRQVSLVGKGKEKFAVYRCMECYRKQGER